MTGHILTIPFADGSHEILATDDPLGQRAIARVARFLHLKDYCRDGEIPSDTSIFFTTTPPGAGWQPWDATNNFKGQLFWEPSSPRFHFQLAPGETGQGDLTRIARRAIYLAVCRHSLTGESFMLHGTMLSPDDSSAHVIFGQSGMGKSTASLRFIAQGGTCLADDRMVVTRMPDGQYRVQPMPTWSRLGTCDISVPFTDIRSILSMTMLVRGHDDEIAPANPSTWRLELVSDISEYLYIPANWIGKSLIRRIVDGLLPRATLLQKYFGSYEMHGDLQGHIFDHLSNYHRP